MLSAIGKLGIADPETWAIQLKSTFATSHRFDVVRDVFLHEVAHLWESVYPDGKRETSHGPIFRTMCKLLGADPQATNKNSQLVLGVDVITSAIGGLMGAVFLMAAAPLLAEVALKFTSFEYFWLAALGLSPRS